MVCAHVRALERRVTQRHSSVDPAVDVCETGLVEAGEQMFLWCEGGPAAGRAVLYPPPLELDAEGGAYVLVDDGTAPSWRYEFVPERR